MSVQRRYILTILVCILLSPLLPAYANENLAKTKTILSNMEGNAEDLVDAALAKKIASSWQLYQNIQKNMARLHHTMAGAPFNERRSRELLMAYSWMRVVAVDLKHNAWIGTAIAANQLTASMIRFTHYPTLQQRDISWMDYLGRELLLLNLEDPVTNAQLLDARRADLVNIWDRIKKALIIKDFRNKPLILQGENIIQHLQDDHTPQMTITTARKLLIFVDKLVQVK